MEYQVPVVMIDRASPRTRDSVYFAALCKNFSLLQEGNVLSPSDRYCSVVSDPVHNFQGAPIVNFTITGIGRVDKFENYFGISEVGPREKNRKKLANAVALISGIMLGPKFANESFYSHLPTLFDPINDLHKNRFQHILKLFFDTIEQCTTLLPKWSCERFKGYFNKTKLFTGLMIADVFENFPITEDILMNDTWRTFSAEFTARWNKLINTYRARLQREDKRRADEWLESNVYSGLGVGQKRNSKEGDLICRMKAVRAWSEQ